MTNGYLSGSFIQIVWENGKKSPDDTVRAFQIVCKELNTLNILDFALSLG